MNEWEIIWQARSTFFTGFLNTLEMFILSTLLGLLFGILLLYLLEGPDHLLRRSIRSMRLLGVHDPVLPTLLPISKELMQVSYPEVAAQWQRVSQSAYGEEDAFRRTLASGTQIFDVAVAAAQRENSSVLAGDKAFQLHDTYGFPIDLTLEMASEAGLEVDQQQFRTLMQEQKDRAKADARAKKGGAVNVEAYRTLRSSGETPFLGFTELTVESPVRGIVADGRLVDVVLDDHRDLAHSPITPALTPRAESSPPPAAPPSSPPAGAAPSGPVRNKLTAPMPGVVLSVDTTVGAEVSRGDVVATLEAMKMVNQLRAPRDGVVAEIYVNAGDQVRYGETLIRFEDAP